MSEKESSQKETETAGGGPAEGAAEGPTSPGGADKGHHVLIVDDSESIRRLVREALESMEGIGSKPVLV